MTKRTWAKQTLLKIGKVTKENYKDEFINFLKNADLIEEKNGIIFEYALSFTFGVFQQKYYPFSVIMTDYLDDVEKVDFQINNHRVQVKLDWDLNRSPIDPEQWWRDYAISVKFFHKRDKASGFSTSGSDILSEILRTVGFSKQLIDAQIDDNPAYDAAEEIFSWLFE